MKMAHFGVKKMGHFASVPRHQPTCKEWSCAADDDPQPGEILNFIGWNVNGIRSALSKKSFPGALLDLKPDFICLN